MCIGADKQLKHDYGYKSMFSRGFTLAEVLVTLAIIGIIAALTIPALINNIQKSQFGTAFKKQFSVFTQAANQIIQDKGSFLGLTNYPALFGSYMSVTKTCNNSATEGCWHASNQTYYLDGTPAGIPDNSVNKTFGSKGFILSDGTLVVTLDYWNLTCSASVIKACGWIVVDVNGFKGPNTVGKDVFCLWVKENRILPAGTSGTFGVPTAEFNCTGSYGWGCAYSVITQ